MVSGAEKRRRRRAAAAEAASTRDNVEVSGSEDECTDSSSQTVYPTHHVIIIIYILSVAISSGAKHRNVRRRPTRGVTLHYRGIQAPQQMSRLCCQARMRVLRSRCRAGLGGGEETTGGVAG